MALLASLTIVAAACGDDSKDTAATTAESAAVETTTRDTAAPDAGEFFAVACETFFSRPTALAARHPAVYDVLRRYFDQDPAGWSVG